MKFFKEFVEEINESLIILKKNCEFCGKHVKKYQRKDGRPYKFVFINITQKPPNHYFCSKKCKILWIFSPNKRQVFNLEAPSIPNP
ncbi:MAG: hypothetical protein KGD65_04105 [Candidatus Lokiarchaeota archaeon]|nr:hypothetical protein [Candidatus Lokiarchaeota archaeon]